MTTASSLARTIRADLYELFDRDVVLIPNTILATETAVTWGAPATDEPFVDFLDYATVSTYARWATSGQYSAMLYDGALLQIRYDLDPRGLLGHRLAYVPCPYRVDPGLLSTEPISDVLELYESGPHSSITMQSAVRFDYDPRSATADHPATHLTLNVASCRIACEAPMRPSHFLQFVFRNFYPETWQAHSEFFTGLTRAEWGSSTVTPDERLAPHLAWRPIETTDAPTRASTSPRRQRRVAS